MIGSKPSSMITKGDEVWRKADIENGQIFADLFQDLLKKKLAFFHVHLRLRLSQQAIDFLIAVTRSVRLSFFKSGSQRK